MTPSVNYHYRAFTLFSDSRTGVEMVDSQDVNAI
jgi:hypothetical protein